MDVVFLGRNFSDKMPITIPVQVERYSWHMTGGPERATLKAPVTADKWELTKLLRVPVEIYGDDGRPKWWGFVGRVTIPHNNQMVGVGLDEMYNDITIDYNGGSTDNTDPQSISMYGTKQYRLAALNSTSDAATNIMNVYLADHKYPRSELELSGGNSNIRIECYGWYSTLGWKYYEVSSSSNNVDNATQISTIVASAGQFINGTILEDTAGVTSDKGRDGKSTALTYVNELLGAGTSNVLPLLATVDRNRYLHVYEQKSEPNTEKLHLLDEDNRLITKLGRVVPDQDCNVALWVRMKGVPNIIGGYAAMRPFFIARAEYDAEKDKTRYEPADGYEQRRLAKYLESGGTGGGGSGGGTGGGGNPYKPPPVQAATLSAMFVTGGSTTDIAAGSDAFMHPQSTLSTGVDYGNVILHSGSVAGGARLGWVAQQTSRYIIIADFFFNSGTSAPTDGWVTGFLYRSRVSSGVLSYFAQQSFHVPSGGFTSDVTGFSLVGTTKINANDLSEGFEFRLRNYSDGDIVWTALYVTFILLGAP